MRSLAELASMRVANVAFLNKGWCLPRKWAFASARGGMTGFSRQRWSTQVLQHQDAASLTPKRHYAAARR